MKWKAFSIRYMNCISRSSRSGLPTLSPLRNVCSRTAPVFRFLSFVLTNAPPFPGLTCWKYTITYGSPPNSIFSPFRKSAAEYIRLSPSGKQQRLLGKVGPPLSPTPRHTDHVLDPDPPQPGDIHPGLHGHDHPLRKPVFRPWGQGGALVDVQPHSVARGMNKILQISRTIQRFPHPGIHVPAPDPRPEGPSAPSAFISRSRSAATSFSLLPRTPPESTSRRAPEAATAAPSMARISVSSFRLRSPSTGSRSASQFPSFPLVRKR